jgi:peptide deformylase
MDQGTPSSTNATDSRETATAHRDGREKRETRRPSGAYRVSVRRVLARPDARLALPAVDVDPCQPYIVALADALVATMRASPACVGLAATQVGEPARIFCLDVSGHRKARSCAGLVVMCNPKIVWRSENVVMREGCMSVPHLTGNVARAARVTVEGFEPATGALVRLESDAMEARCLQHEIDHLDGFVFVDRVVDPVADLFPRKTYA